ncbi:hypothetical protein HNY73_001107 [Argiope bruennichi]|uniref:Uncharacterized protein n=1 Tax=Argiope bruennichi TaxID=94029 RepID=A0A8T0G1J5_ARGBR|nr:hypothetical protein HNY73_001107 [Argiope bruennichi]
MEVVRFFQETIKPEKRIHRATGFVYVHGRITPNLPLLPAAPQWLQSGGLRILSPALSILSSRSNFSSLFSENFVSSKLNASLYMSVVRSRYGDWPKDASSLVSFFLDHLSFLTLIELNVFGNSSLMSISALSDRK